MSKIITFASQKGGIGKSSLTMITASALAQEPFNLKVKVIDIDKQKSLVQLRNEELEDYEEVLPYDILDYNIKTLLANINKLDKDNDIILIDSGGKLDNNLPPEKQEISKVLFLTDYLFIPFTSGNFTLNATIDFLKFALDIREERSSSPRPLLITGFINMYVQRLKNDKFLKREMREIKQASGIEFMKNNIGFYNLIKDATTIESIYKPSEEANDYKNFARWLNELIKIIQK